MTSDPDLERIRAEVRRRQGGQRAPPPRTEAPRKPSAPPPPRRAPPPRRSGTPGWFKAFIVIGVIGGGVLLAVHEYRAAQERKFVATLPAGVLPCRTDRPSDRPDGVEFRAVCQRVTYLKTKDMSATDKVWRSEVVGVPGGRPCGDFSAHILNWTLPSGPGVGSVGCFGTKLRWCDMDAGVIGTVDIHPGGTIYNWRRALGHDARQLTNEVLWPSDVGTPLCGNMADV